MVGIIMKKGWFPKNRAKVRVLITALMLFTASAQAAPKILIDEQFASLEQWEPFFFPKIDNHSSYDVKRKPENQEPGKPPSATIRHG